MVKATFQGNFTQQEAIPEDAIAAAQAVLRTGRSHRYDTVAGETSETALLEEEFARYLGAQFCLACASGGYAMHIAMRAFGVQKDEPVLTDAFTLSPVPGAIDNAGGKPLLVESTGDLVIDLADLETKIRTSGARPLLLEESTGVPVAALLEQCRVRGVAIKWFGGREPSAYTSRHDSWRYVEPQQLPQSDKILEGLCDLRIPLTFSEADCALIGAIVKEVFEELREAPASRHVTRQAAVDRA